MICVILPAQGAILSSEIFPPFTYISVTSSTDFEIRLTFLICPITGACDAQIEIFAKVLSFYRSLYFPYTLHLMTFGLNLRSPKQLSSPVVAAKHICCENINCCYNKPEVLLGHIHTRIREN